MSGKGDALNVDAWKLYCEIYREMFGRPMKDDYAVSPAAIMVLGDRLRTQDFAAPQGKVAPDSDFRALKNGPSGQAGNPAGAAPTTSPSETATTHGINIPPDLDSTTAQLVLRFATALAEKLRAAEIKYGYSDMWKLDDWKELCQERLAEHMQKGDPRDVANYCMFMWHHGWSTTPKRQNPKDAQPSTGRPERWVP